MKQVMQSASKRQMKSVPFAAHLLSVSILLSLALLVLRFGGLSL